jgi:hypothetical protein
MAIVDRVIKNTSNNRILRPRKRGNNVPEKKPSPFVVYESLISEFKNCSRTQCYTVRALTASNFVY